MTNNLKPFHHVPTTVSKDAQEYLRNAIPVGGPIESTDAFRSIRSIFADVSKKDNDQAIQAHVKKIRHGLIADVPVTVVTPKGYDNKEGNIVIYIHGGAYTLGSADGSVTFSL